MAFPFTPAQEEAVQQYAIALFNMQIGSETMDEVFDAAMAPSIGSLDGAFNMYYKFFFVDVDAEDMADTILANVGIVEGQFGLDADDVLVAKTFVADELAATPMDERGALVSDILAGFATLTEDATFGEAATAFNNEVAIAVDYAGTADVPLNDDDLSFKLTAGDDDMTGRGGDDFFDAPLTQSSFVGGVSNSLSSGDSLDGGAGVDTLNAVLVSEFTGGDEIVDITPPAIAHIENIQLEVMDNVTDGVVTFDAKNVTDVDHIGSFFSDGDLIIENLTTLTSAGATRNTSEITVTMDHTDNTNHDGDASDLTVLFDEDYLITDKDTSGASLTLRMLNAFTNVTDGNPIEGFDSIIFSVGTTVINVNVEAIAADDTLDYTDAYDAVVVAINAELVAQGFSSVTAAKADIEPAVFSIRVGDYATGDSAGEYYPITLTNTGPEVLAGIAIEQAQLDYDTDMNNSFSTTPPSSFDNPVSVNVELTKVGRAGEGGYLEIGGKEDAGIPVFNVTVLGDDDKPSHLSELRSTNNYLEEVYVTSAVGADLDGENGTADLTIDQLTDVRVFDATGLTGDLTLNADLNSSVVAKYMDLQDGAANAAADNDIFMYDGGTGNDSFDVEIDAGNLAFEGTTTREDFEFTLNGNAGDDTLQVSIVEDTEQGIQLALNDSSNWYLNHQINANIEVNGNAGDDTIWTPGAGDFTITGGAGNDTIYTDNTGEQNLSVSTDSVGAFSKAMYVFNSVNTELDDLQSNLAQTASGVNLFLTVNFRGLESTVEVGNSDGAAANVTISDLTINQAIKDAINNDDILNKLIVAEDGPGRTLLVTSLIDGVQVATDLAVSFDTEALSLGQAAAGVSLVNTGAAVFGEYTTSMFATDGALATTVVTPATLESATQVLVADSDAGDIFSVSIDGAAPLTYTSVTAEALDVVGAGIAGLSALLTYDAATDTITYTSATPGAETNIVFSESVATTTTLGTLTVNNGADAVTAVTNNIDGQDSTFESNNTITPGADDDVTVLSTGELSNETVVFDAAFGDDVIVNFAAGVGTDADVLDFTEFIGNATTLFTVHGPVVDGGVTIMAETTANDSVAEIAALYGDSLTAGDEMYIAYDGDNIGNVYHVQDGTGATDLQVTLLGTIDLADTGWATLTIDNFA